MNSAALRGGPSMNHLHQPIPKSQYFDLVDQSGRMLRQGKRGSIDPDMPPILSRIGAQAGSVD